MQVPEVKAMPRPSMPMAKPVSNDAREVVAKEEEEEEEEEVPSPAESWPDKSWSGQREWEGWEGWQGGWRGYDWSSHSSNSSWENKSKWPRRTEPEPTPPAWRQKPQSQSRRPAVPKNSPKANAKYSPPPQQRQAAKGGRAFFSKPPAASHIDRHVMRRLQM